MLKKRFLFLAVTSFLFLSVISIQAYGQGIVINFDDADLYEVIRTFSELLNINVIVDPNVQGKVTVHTAGEMEMEDLFPVFFQLLEANGLTAVREGNLYRVIPFNEAPRMPVSPRRDITSGAPGERIVIQIIPLDFISTEEITKLLTPFISAQGTIVSHGDSKTLVVVDRGTNIEKILRLVRVFDVDAFEQLAHRFYRLEHADAEETAGQLREIIALYSSSEGLMVIPFPRLNMLLVMSPDVRLFDTVEEVIQKVDVPLPGIVPRIHVYFVKNGQAGELSELLNMLFSQSSDTDSQTRTQLRPEPQIEGKKNANPIEMPFGNEKSPPPRKEATAEASVSPIIAGTETSNTLKSEVKIIPDEIRNALIIEATPKDYAVIEKILDQLDVLPRQVLIEVTIAEISLDSKTDLGVEWSYVKGDGGELSTSLLSANIGSAGLQYVIGQTDRWRSALSALATENKINILSSPSVLASDNKEAKIDISTEIPVASAQYQYDSGSEPILQTNIQYRNTGLILSVTPHINEYGLVSMEISQEVSEQSDSVNVGNESMPSFFKRSVSTSLTVMHGQTIVIGGLIQEKQNEGVSGVPCLSQIPGLDFLFGKKSRSKEKGELILLITPRVINSLEDVDAVTDAFKRKVGNAIGDDSF